MKILDIGGEFALLLALIPFVQMEDPPPLLIIAMWLACIATKAVIPILARRDGESWSRYLGPLSRSTWLYAAGGILARAETPAFVPVKLSLALNLIRGIEVFHVTPG